MHRAQEEVPRTATAVRPVESAALRAYSVAQGSQKMVTAEAGARKEEGKAKGFFRTNLVQVALRREDGDVVVVVVA